LLLSVLVQFDFSILFFLNQVLQQLCALLLGIFKIEVTANQLLLGVPLKDFFLELVNQAFTLFDVIGGDVHFFNEFSHELRV